MLASVIVLLNVSYFVAANLMRASARFLPGSADSFSTRPIPHRDRPRVRPLELPQELVISSMASPSTIVPSPSVGAQPRTVFGHGLTAPLNTPSVNASLTMSAPLAVFKRFVVLLMSANPEPLAPDPPHMVSGITVSPYPAHTCATGRLWPVQEPYCVMRGSFGTTHTSSITYPVSDASLSTLCLSTAPNTSQPPAVSRHSAAGVAARLLAASPCGL